MNRTIRVLAVSAATAVVISATALGLTGCSQDADQTVVVTGQKVEEQQGLLTPLQRGVIRRDVLRAAKPALAAWQSGDASAMSKAWDKPLVDQYRKIEAGYAAKNEKRVRDFKVSTIDVVEFNNTGSQALVDAWGYDYGYVVSSSGAKTMRSNPKRLQQIQLTVVKDKKTGSWTVKNAIMSNALKN